MSSALRRLARRGRRHRGLSCSSAKCWRPRQAEREDGFTLLELVIVVAIMPLVVGGLSVGLIAVFSLQSSVVNRMTDTMDSQTVASVFQKDIQAAAYLTTDGTTPPQPQCGPGIGTQLLGLEEIPYQSSGGFQEAISYVLVSTTSNGTTTTSLERLDCSVSASGAVAAPSSTMTLAYDLPNAVSAPTVTCAPGASSECSANAQQWTTGWVSAEDVASVDFNVTAPKTSYNYNLVASPADNQTFASGGVATSNIATCEPTSSSSSPYSGSLCLVDFSGLTSNEIAEAAAPNCYNMSVLIETSDVLHFCLQFSSTYSGESFVTSALPADTDAGLGGAEGVYQGVGGEPALYMSAPIGTGQTATFTLSSIYVVNASTGLRETGWDLVSADAETANTGEFYRWTSQPASSPWTLLDDANPEPNPVNNYVGNACDEGKEITGNGTTTVTCGDDPSDNTGDPDGTVMTGAAMVSAPTPTTVSVTMNNYAAVVFGMLLP